ncbi:hypothetical protein E2C01_085378 [Portunus trituberculatus]|uniref:Uncharacterized protein n=1 Tax=Portunus trituberculatus TaxID=210409 RepID=A0A5B7JDF6_PORTR|nr:hypothetical protein [Portunus trituberculatus]
MYQFLFLSFSPLYLLFFFLFPFPSFQFLPDSFPPLLPSPPSFPSRPSSSFLPSRCGISVQVSLIHAPLVRFLSTLRGAVTVSKFTQVTLLCGDQSTPLHAMPRHHAMPILLHALTMCHSPHGLRSPLLCLARLSHITSTTINYLMFLAPSPRHIQLTAVYSH